MSRIVKSADERRIEIIKTAEYFFNERGFSKTSVETIIKKIGVAKGTFYYYFKSKEEVLKAVVEMKLDQMVNTVEQIADEPSIDALSKMKLLLSGSQMGSEEEQKMTEHLHLPGNRELHEVTNIQTILKLSPIFARIIEQGNKEKIFHVEKPLETIRLLLAGAQFLLDGDLFHFTEYEEKEQRIVLQEIVEKALEAPKGSFSFMQR